MSSAHPGQRIEGRLRLVLRKPGGPPLVEREVCNTVVRSGAELLAALFRGEVSTPVNAMAVGIDSTPPSPPYEVTALTTATLAGDAAILRPAVVVSAESMRTEVLASEFKVRVHVRGVLPQDRGIGPDPANPRVLIGEAALGVLAEDGEHLERIYNRVVFEPVPKTDEHELALYWEVDFPFGP